MGIQETRPLDYTTKVVYDPTLAPGEQVVEQEGAIGVETLQADGTWKVTKPAQDQIIRVGAMVSVDKDQLTWETPIQYPTEVRVNPDLKPGEYKIVQPGELGSKTTTVDISTDENGNIITGDPKTETTKEPVTQIIEVGPGQNYTHTVTDPIPYDISYEFDPSLPAGKVVVDQEGVPGTITTTIVGINGEKPEVTSEVTLDPVSEKIRIGTGVENKTEVIPFETKIEFDPTMKPGTKEVIQEGKPGLKTQDKDGNWVVVEEPVDEIVKVGSQLPSGEQEIKWTEPINYPTEVRVNPDLKPGEYKIVQQGELGEKTHTATVTFDENGNGTVSDPTSETTKQPVTQIIEIGPGAETVPAEGNHELSSEIEVDLPYDTKYIYDPNLPAGETKIDKEGSNGRKVIKVIQKYEDGKLVSEERTEEIVKEPTDEVVRIGTGCECENPTEPSQPSEPTDPTGGDVNIAIGELNINIIQLMIQMGWLDGDALAEAISGGNITIDIDNNGEITINVPEGTVPTFGDLTQKPNEPKGDDQKGGDQKDDTQKPSEPSQPSDSGSKGDNLAPSAGDSKGDKPSDKPSTDAPKGDEQKDDQKKVDLVKTDPADTQKDTKVVSSTSGSNVPSPSGASSKAPAASTSTGKSASGSSVAAPSGSSSTKAASSTSRGAKLANTGVSNVVWTLAAAMILMVAGAALVFTRRRNED